MKSQKLQTNWYWEYRIGVINYSGYRKLYKRSYTRGFDTILKIYFPPMKKEEGILVLKKMEPRNGLEIVCGWNAEWW